MSGSQIQIPPTFILELEHQQFINGNQAYVNYASWNGASLWNLHSFPFPWRAVEMMATSFVVTAGAGDSVTYKLYHTSVTGGNEVFQIQHFAGTVGSRKTTDTTTPRNYTAGEQFALTMVGTAGEQFALTMVGTITSGAVFGYPTVHVVCERLA
jgi:hypothetical protein